MFWLCGASSPVPFSIGMEKGLTRFSAWRVVTETCLRFIAYDCGTERRPISLSLFRLKSCRYYDLRVRDRMEALFRIDILLGSVVLYSSMAVALFGTMFAVIAYAMWSGWQVFRSAKLEFQRADEHLRGRICDQFESSEEAIWVLPPFLETRGRFKKFPPDNCYLFFSEIDGVTRYVPKKDLVRALKQREHTKA